jgi:hypothetical protein
MASEKLNKLLVDKTFMANLNGVTHGSILAHLKPGTLVQTLIVVAGQLGCLLSRPRQHGKEKIEPLGLELEVSRKLPENGPEFGPKVQQPLGEKVCQRSFDIPQSKHVGYIAGALDGKSKVWRRLGTPPGKALRPL